MNEMLRPTGLMLVGVIFICLSLMLNALGAEADLPDLKNEMKKSLSGTLDQSQGSAIGKLRIHGDTITFPWSVRYKSGSGPIPLMPMPLPSKEEIALNETDPKRAVNDLTAINGIKERDIFYDGSQSSDPETQDLSNSLEISVTGPEEVDDRSIFWNKRDASLDIEKVVDEAMNRDRRYDPVRSNTTRSRSAPMGNNMIIDVSGISVSALNTVKGGSATATSNIIIRPVQIIVCPSEVEEKLK